MADILSWLANPHEKLSPYAKLMQDANARSVLDAQSKARNDDHAGTSAVTSTSARQPRQPGRQTSTLPLRIS